METWLRQASSALPPPRPSHHHIPPSPCFLSERPASSPLSGWCFEKHLSPDSDSQAFLHPEDGEALRVVLLDYAALALPSFVLSVSPHHRVQMPSSFLSGEAWSWAPCSCCSCGLECSPFGSLYSFPVLQGFCFNITPSRGHPVWNSSPDMGMCKSLEMRGKCG